MDVRRSAAVTRARPSLLGPALLSGVAVVAGVVLVLVGLRAQVSEPVSRDLGSVDAPRTAAAPAGSPARRGGRSVLGRSLPTRIRIPAIGVDTQVNRLGLAGDGTLEVPQPGPELNQAAWFENSPTPGQPGPAIIEGHVDSTEGPSVFLKLAALRPGNKIDVTRADGTRLTFTVDGLRDYAKADFPTQVVYGGDLSRPQLRLITCSDFDTAIGHHTGNTVVYSHLTHVTSPRSPS